MLFRGVSFVKSNECSNRKHGRFVVFSVSGHEPSKRIGKPKEHTHNKVVVFVSRLSDDIGLALNLPQVAVWVINWRSPPPPLELCTKVRQLEILNLWFSGFPPPSPYKSESLLFRISRVLLFLDF